MQYSGVTDVAGRPQMTAIRTSRKQIANAKFTANSSSSADGITDRARCIDNLGSSLEAYEILCHSDKVAAAFSLFLIDEEGLRISSRAATTLL